MTKVPASTYRLQLHKGFKFDDAAAIAQYLYDLGVTHVYSSPYLQAAPDSMHGYDVVDHQRVNEELGGAEAHKRFSKTLGENGLGQVLDIVPNHMAIGRENRFWWDVLENGASSRYASFFDIDWQPQEERLRDKVLVPILADQYGRVLEAGDIKVIRNGPLFLVEAAGQTFPVAPTSLPAILARAADYSNSDTLRFIAASFGRLPQPSFEDRRTVLARHRDKAVLNTLLERLCAEDHPACTAIDRAIDDLNARHDALDDFLNQQNYRLAYWKTADQQLGYRRFFDVNSLIGLRMERAHVFEETHALILEWLRQGVLDGVRVDHPDGLRDPLEYFQRLRAAAPDAWIIGEKILEPGEFLRENWPIEGTSGYDFLNVALGVLVSPDGLEKLTQVYADFTAQPVDFHVIAHDKKIAVSQEALGSDVNRITSLLIEICENNRNYRDTTRAEARRALRELAGCFAIYRTYVVPSRNEINDEDRSYIHRAIECAKSNRADLPPTLFDFLEDILTLKVTGRLETEFTLRFQQFTSPVMAKGVEDTAFYCFNRLTGMCEVGGDPGRNGLTIDQFHEYQSKMQQTHPSTMTTLSTHDTKRADDVRARLSVLSELPEEFASAIQSWTAANEQFKANTFPDPNTEYFLYQTLIGAWPIDAERTKTYMLKAMREAKQQTSWVANNKPFEDALFAFIDAILTHAPFVDSLSEFVAKLLVPGRVNSLTQSLLKYTAPGVPDLYQGGELWDHSLVDPDNRRPVDYDLRRKLLAQIAVLPIDKISASINDPEDKGVAKLFLVHRALQLRRQQPTWFGPEAAYTPVKLTGPAASHALAYLRGDHVLTIVPLHTAALTDGWDDTAVQLPEGRWSNQLAEEPHRSGKVLLADLFTSFAVALLTRDDNDAPTAA
ncbi:malto-oligosyltrehalose synthase [Granulicella tundricola]|uniref:Malto-oligosyltrehalose synthase n=1 Tax=Granulicella tundricola (strain ATCC BAA-1859 / DSM 23138 / MP5ACTX9) TaxID=1198114 RepID=E8WYY9_GRATM|nr:malto-oligosyltrehalose synthase [Granulicella tundricola]ADW69904.1 malto-oligosyltrehalose synthase [Granulicella tundricola MP5ACTX9]